MMGRLPFAVVIFVALTAPIVAADQPGPMQKMVIIGKQAVFRT